MDLYQKYFSIIVRLNRKSVRIEETWRTLSANVDLIDRKTKAQYTFFSKANKTFTKIGHIAVYKTNLNKLKSIQII